MLYKLESGLDLLALQRRDRRRYPCLLESVTAGAPHATHDLLFVANGQHLTLHGPGTLVGEGADSDATDFLSRLDHWWQSLRLPPSDTDTLPFHGGWFLYLGYELAGEIEPRLRLTAPATTPIACALRSPAALIRDHDRQALWLVVEDGQQALAEAVFADIAAIASAPTRDAAALPALPAVTLDEDPPAAFLDGVRRIQHYITAGDVFQVNLSRAWHGSFAAPVDPTGLYRRLRIGNPAPFAALAHLDGATLLSSSPERLVSVRNGSIETRPIAGTRPRGADPAADRALSERLLAHPKERAEHIMLIDLERNDLGRVCLPGTVKVSELMAIESYAHVHHIVSNVQGRLRPAVTPGEVIRAVFPGGTITGCPKVRCMEIISEIEQCARGPYTGSLGYLDRNGNLDLNILIRTLELQGQRMFLRAGAGIVADSVPGKELDETRSKARGLLKLFDS